MEISINSMPPSKADIDGELKVISDKMKSMLSLSIFCAPFVGFAFLYLLIKVTATAIPLPLAIFDFSLFACLSFVPYLVRLPSMFRERLDASYIPESIYSNVKHWCSVPEVQAYCYAVGKQQRGLINSEYAMLKCFFEKTEQNKLGDSVSKMVLGCGDATNNNL